MSLIKKPSADPKVSQVATGQDQENGKPEGVARTRSILGQLAEENPELDLDELKNRREEFADSMKERQMERLTNKMAQWGAALGLDEDQQKQMVEIADQQLSELEEIAVSASESGDPAAISESAKRAMAIMSGRALEDSMGELLTPEQQEKHEEFGERQNQSRAEGRTLRQLASLQEDLMLTPEQRNDVYGVLYENSVASVQDDSGISSMIEILRLPIGNEPRPFPSRGDFANRKRRSRWARLRAGHGPRVAHGDGRKVPPASPSRSRSSNSARS